MIPASFYFCPVRRSYLIPVSSPLNRQELLLAVLSSQPTSRDAKAFLKNFGGERGIPRLREREQQREANLAAIGSRKHENLALVYLQAGLADAELRSFASSLVQLQRLGLLPVVMLRDIEPHSPANRNMGPNQGSSTLTGLAGRMYDETVRVAGLIDQAGGRGMPIYQGVFAVDGPTSYFGTTLGKQNSEDGTVVEDEETVATEMETGITADPRAVLHAIRYGQIPVITPLAYSDTHYVPVATTKAMVELSRTLQKQGTQEAMSPLKVILVNDHGGIQGTKGPLSMVNLREDYADLVSNLSPLADADENLLHERIRLSARESLNELWTIKQTLDNLPASASAIVASASVSAAAISNLITDKPTFSSSLDEPPDTFLVDGKPVDSMNAPTVIRNGLRVSVHSSLDHLDLSRLAELLEASFGRKLDHVAFWSRMRHVMDKCILAGDYDGASIMTREGSQGLIYLDKFAASPKSQGTGVADILWRRMGKEYPLWFWRSRTVNPVNKWYVFVTMDRD